MANEHRGETTISIGGTEYTVRLTFNGVANAEHKGHFVGGASVTDVLGRMAEGHVFFGDLRALFWASRPSGESLTIDEAGEVLGSDPNQLVEIGNVLSRALAELFPQTEAAEGN